MKILGNYPIMFVSKPDCQEIIEQLYDGPSLSSCSTPDYRLIFCMDAIIMSRKRMA